MRCEFLPPYSPDYNPIEFAFLAIKADFCQRSMTLTRDTTELAILIMIHNSVFSITPEDAYGWFRECGYG
jgi:transposase